MTSPSIQNGFFIHSSNRLEELAGTLAEILNTPSGPSAETALTPETIVVQSKGMERWLSLAVARHNGISANCRFPFPNTFVTDIFASCLDEVSVSNYFDPHVMTFRIMALLPGLIDTPAFEPVRRYLTDDPDQRKLFQLSGRIADAFDQYVVFRPEMVSRWDTHAAEDEACEWQAILWRAVTRGELRHRGRMHEIFLKRVAAGGIDPARLPGRAFIFGISYMPLFHLQIMEALASLLPVHLFLLNPCREYWGEIVSESEQKKIRNRYEKKIQDESDLLLERGNRLLASLGGMGRDFFSHLTAMDTQFHESFHTLPEDNLLHCIQGDILDLRDRLWRFSTGDTTESERHIASLVRESENTPLNDDSVQIHSCHSPMREVEVLHDQLLEMLEGDPDLMPKDIMVMAPDIDRYTPYIKAVFDTPERSTERILYTIADRSMRTERRVVNDFLKLIELKNCRLGATHILSVLESPYVKETFALSPGDMTLVEQWVRETNIRWGRDKCYKEALNLPGFEEHTWRFGLNRMLLGYALPGEEAHLFSDILPFDHIEGKDGLVLGRFIAFLERLFALLQVLDEPKPLHQWAEVLQTALMDFFGRSDPIAAELRSIRDTLALFREIERMTENAQPITFEVVFDDLKQILSSPMYGTGFISGGVTFCSMLPMRAIPAKVICMMGMQNDAFPRESHFPSFNLIAASPRTGDRSRRNDDKYLFLESLISARDKFYISYVGQSIQDNAVIPPSGLVSELLDYLREGFGIAPEAVITQHRLQAFSPAYFRDDTRLFSYSDNNSRASRALAGKKTARRFFTKPLPVPPSEFQYLHDRGFTAFYSKPCRYLLEERLGILLQTRGESVEDREIFNLNELDRFRLGQQLLDVGLSGKLLGTMSFAGKSPDDLFKVQRAKGSLPSGKVGKLLFRDLQSETELFKEKIMPYIGDYTPERMDYRVALGVFECYGSLEGLYPDAMVCIRFGKTRPEDLLSTFIRHLILCRLADDSLPEKTYLFCRDFVWEFYPVSDPEALLGIYLNYYWKGLQYPLPFFPRASYEYARRIILKGEFPDAALIAAQKKWEGSDFVPGEGSDPYNRLCFNTADPLDADFENTALEIFKPLLASCTEIFA